MAKKKNIVKATRGSFNLIFIAVIILGWLLVGVTILSAEDPVSEQNAIINTARGYLEDKLYIRAVAQYRSALSTYKTENNNQYETELLAIYREAGMTNEYFSLIDSRISAGTAAVEEYLERAQNYVSQRQAARAMTLIQRGMDKFGDEAFLALYESVSYENSSLTTAYTNVLMPDTDWYIPAYDGEHWGYINEKGRTVIDFIYDEATCFDGSYAVVKTDGSYVLIDKNGYWNAVDKNGLDTVTAIAEKRIIGIKNGQYGIYTNTFNPVGTETYDNIYISDNGIFAVQKDGRWSILDANLQMVTDTQFADVAVNSRGQIFSSGYAVVADERGYFLINEAGEARFDTRFPDAKGMEGGLIAVADTSGRWGFANERGEVVVDYQYEDANSFSDRLAAVKYAGKWGYINRYNTMIIEQQYAQAYPFLAGMALVVDDRGNYRIITLDNYDLF